MGLLSFLYGTISHVSFEGEGHSILNRPSLNIRHLDQRYKVVKFFKYLLTEAIPRYPESKM